MKKFLLALFLFSSICLYGTAEPEGRMKIAYTDGGMSLKLGMMIPLDLQQAIEIPQSLAQRMSGARITKMRVAVADNLSEQNNYMFVTAGKMNLTDFDYKQTVEKLEKGWNEIILKEPYVIEGSEKLFVGFKVRSSGEVVSMDGRADNELGNWVRITEHEDDTSSEWLHQDGGCMNIEVFVEGDNLPKNDIMLESMEARSYAPKSGTSPVTLVVKNNASKTIISADVKICVDGEELETRTIENLNIESGNYAVINVGSVVFPSKGLHDLSMEIVKVNGEDDENTVDNKAVKENINCKDDYVNRTVLLEHFSTMLCPNCPFAHKKMEAYLPYKVDFVHVIHHSGFGKDPLTIDESTKYEYFYSDGTQSKLYAPAAMLDRVNLSKYGANDGENSTLGPIFAINLDTFNALVDKALSTPAYTSVNIEKKFDEESRKLTVTVSGAIPTDKAMKHINVDNTLLNIFITEDGIVGTQNGSDTPKHFIHDNVMRKVLTQVWGDAVVYNNREFVSKTYEYVIPSDFDVTKMHVIAFLSTYDAAQPNNCEVYNTAYTDLMESEMNGIEDVVDNETDIKMTVGDRNLYIYGAHGGAQIYDAAGNVLMNIAPGTFKSNLDSMCNGLYIIKVRTAGGFKSMKFII